MEQGLRKLKVNKKKESKVEITHTVVVGSFDTFNFYLLFLSNSFNFDLSFSILPDVISNNIPIYFL